MAPPYDRSAALTSAAQVLKAPGTQAPRGIKPRMPAPGPTRRRPPRQAPYASQTGGSSGALTSANGGGSRTFDIQPQDRQPSLRGFSPGSTIPAPAPGGPSIGGAPGGPDVMMPPGDSMDVGMDKPAWQQLADKGIGGQGSAAANKALAAGLAGGGVESMPGPPVESGPGGPGTGGGPFRDPAPRTDGGGMGREIPPELAGQFGQLGLTARKPLLRGFGGGGVQSPPYVPSMDATNPGDVAPDKPMGDLGGAGPDIWSRIAGARKQTPLIPQRF